MDDFDKTHGNETEVWYHVGTTDEPLPPDDRRQAGFVVSFDHKDNFTGLIIKNSLTDEVTDTFAAPLMSGDRLFFAVSDKGLFQEIAIDGMTVYKRDVV